MYGELGFFWGHLPELEISPPDQDKDVQSPGEAATSAEIVALVRREHRQSPESRNRGRA
jgi:hypothetical protein